MAFRSFPLQSLPCFPNFRISFSGGSRRAIVMRASAATPARDRIINFGKHKGKMLGAIPSGYLKWVSQNVTSEWANLAKQVLEDPIYRDRLEWELADNLLSGENRVADLNAAEELHDIADRFGWDFEDRDGWGKVKFPLLGTSKSGRLPRISERRTPQETTKTETEKAVVKDLCLGEGRRERIERQRTKREIGKLQEKKLKLGIEPRTAFSFATRRISAGADARPQKTRLARTDNGEDDRTAQETRYPFPGRRMDGEDGRSAQETCSPFVGRRTDGEDGRTAHKTRSPFPGREAFLKKVLDRQKPL